MSKAKYAYTRDDVFRGGPGLDGYTWRADVWCEDCVREAFQEPGPFSEAEFFDSDCVPQPIFFGDHEVRQHCCRCHKYLYGGANVKVQKPRLDHYDLVLVIEGGLLTYVADVKGRGFKALVIDRDVIKHGSDNLDELDGPLYDEAIQVIRELAEEAEEYPEADTYAAEGEVVVED